MITANLIADSIYQQHRVSTFVLEYPRFIHSELKTHRVFSTNSASSRAIPLDKMIELVENNTVIPMWTKNQKGMSGEFVEDSEIIRKADSEWRDAMKDAVKHVRALQALGIHKQDANRLLEPFQHIKTILTGTDFKNFFNLRIAPGVQPEARKLAELMKIALCEHTPVQLKPGQIHCPFIEGPVGVHEADKIFESVALCAQVSYRKDDRSPETVKRVVEKLLSDPQHFHASPFEHQCWPYRTTGNLPGYGQLRHYIESIDPSSRDYETIKSMITYNDMVWY